AQPADEQRLLDLVGAVAAIARPPVDLGGREQADVVVVPQGLDAEVGEPGELPDGDGRGHGTQRTPSSTGRVNTRVACRPGSTPPGSTPPGSGCGPVREGMRACP